ncbi:unnamed protein product [Withania somnifera]
MGKKVIDIQPSKSHKKQFNNLIKLLKPKVYITHSSNFKNLVQQLTGNNNIGSPSSSSPIISSSPPPPADHHHDQLELSVDSSEGSIPSSINVNRLHGPCFSLLNSNNDNSMGSQEIMDVSEEYYYRNIESWLLDLDSYSTISYEGLVPLNIHQEVSIDDYGYDLSSLF